MTVQEVYQAVGAYAAGTMSAADVYELENVACPGAGACGGQFTANTMATALEFLGISPAGLNAIPAVHPEKERAAAEAGRIAMELVRDDVRPSQIVTREAIENAVASIAATGGSTNGVLHMLAIAHELSIPFTIDEFDAISARTPALTSLRPSGAHMATDLYETGGLSLVGRELLKRGLLHGDARTVDGRTLDESAAGAVETRGQQVVATIDRPVKPTGGLAVLRGNLAPEGCRCVVKLSGHERLLHHGPARVFDSEEDCFDAVLGGRIGQGGRRRDPLRGGRLEVPACARCCR